MRWTSTPRPELRERLLELVDGGARHVVVDLGRVDFLDSTGLGVLVGALKRLRAASGTFELVCDKEPLLKIFRITALDQVFPLHPTVDAATAPTRAAAVRRVMATVRLSFSPAPVHVRTARLVGVAVARRAGVRRGAAGRGPAGDRRGVHPRGRAAPAVRPGRPGRRWRCPTADSYTVRVMDRAPIEAGARPDRRCRRTSWPTSR